MEGLSALGRLGLEGLLLFVYPNLLFSGLIYRLEGRQRGFSPSSLVSSSIRHRCVILCLYLSSLTLVLTFIVCCSYLCTKVVIGLLRLIIIILILSLKSLWSRWRRSFKNEATYDCLPSCNTADMDVHLIQLSRECIKASIHALKLRHDVLESHFAQRKGGSGCEWSRSGWS